MTLLFGVPLSTGEAAAVAATGLATAGLALLAGRRLLWRAPVSTPDSRFDLEDEPPGLTSTSTGERRTSLRRRGNFVAADLTDGGDEEPLRVWVVDRSLGGLCLLVEAPIDAGSELHVRPQHASGAAQWIPIRVRSCQRDREGWMVHCQFLKLPPMNVMLLFG